MQTTEQPLYRPIGVTILAGFYALCGLFLVVAPLVTLLSGSVIPPWGMLSQVLAVEAFLLVIVLCFMLAWGLWTLNSHVRIGLLILASMVMLTTSPELFSGTKFGVGVFTFALGQSLYLTDSGVSEEFQA